MNVESWLGILGFGGLCGTLGQGARVCVGVKKLSDAASAQKAQTSSLIDVGRLLISLMIGFIAGALSATGIFTAWPNIELPQILSVAAAGYAGADFLEGFINRAIPSPGTPAGQGAVGVGGGGAADGGQTATDGAVG